MVGVYGMKALSMSALSGDGLSTRRRRALLFAGQARHAQFVSGKKLTGHNYLSPESQRTIRKAARGGAGGAPRDLFERFEEMCRRRSLAVDAELRPTLFELLAWELAANHAALGGRKARLVAVTVLQGAIGPELTADPEFERFREAPGVFTQAAVNYPADPRGFLQRLSATIDVLAKEPEFKRFRKTPFVFTQAAMHYPCNPGAFLRKASAAMDALAREPEFKRFRKMPHVFAKAALTYPSNPRAFLRKAARDIDALRRDQEFKHLREAPSLFARAATGYPSNPRAYLRKVAAVTQGPAGSKKNRRAAVSPGSRRKREADQG